MRFVRVFGQIATCGVRKGNGNGGLKVEMFPFQESDEDSEEEGTTRKLATQVGLTSKQYFVRNRALDVLGHGTMFDSLDCASKESWYESPAPIRERSCMQRVRY